MSSGNSIETVFSDNCQIVEGCPIPKLFSAEAFRSAIHYKPRPDDVILVTYPKCGTTWTQNILLLIFNEGKPMDTIKMFSSAPFLEVTGAKAAEVMPRPGAIKVHLPYHLTPQSDEAKYIYVTRNPKDCCVSYFHHEKSRPHPDFKGNFDDFFELFISGNIHYGDYFDHLLEWYAHRNDPNLLFLTYEEMKEDTEASVLKIASFLDDEKYGKSLREDRELLDNILKYSSFTYMKETFNKGLTDMFNMTEEDLENSELTDDMKKLISRAQKIKETEGDSNPKQPNQSKFVRKGIIGDWRNYFTESQSKRMDEKFAERTKGTDIPNFWKQYM